MHRIHSSTAVSLRQGTGNSETRRSQELCTMVRQPKAVKANNRHFSSPCFNDKLEVVIMCKSLSNP